MSRVIPVELPACLEVARQLQVFEIDSQQFDRHVVLMQNCVVELAIGHLAAAHQFLMHGAELQCAKQDCHARGGRFLKRFAAWRARSEMGKY